MLPVQPRFTPGYSRTLRTHSCTQCEASGMLVHCCSLSLVGQLTSGMQQCPALPSLVSPQCPRTLLLPIPGASLPPILSQINTNTKAKAKQIRVLMQIKTQRQSTKFSFIFVLTSSSAPPPPHNKSPISARRRPPIFPTPSKY